MDAKLEKYLETIDRHLKPLPTSERVDIVKEIKGCVLEMKNENLSEEQIMERLGNPKDLAKAYLGDLLANGEGFSWERLLTVCAFYSVVGFSGLFVIPTLAIIAPVCIFFGALTPLLAAVKLVDYLLGLHIPYMDNIQIVVGETVMGAVPAFFISIIMGVILYQIGRGSWKLLVSYCKKVGKTKKDLAI